LVFCHLNGGITEDVLGTDALTNHCRGDRNIFLAHRVL